MKYFACLFYILTSIGPFLSLPLTASYFRDDLEKTWNIKSSKDILEGNLNQFYLRLSTKSSFKKIALEIYDASKPLIEYQLPSPFAPAKELINATHQLAKKTQSLNNTLFKILETDNKQLDYIDRFYLLLITAQALRTTIQKPHRPKTWKNLAQKTLDLENNAKNLAPYFEESEPAYKVLKFLQEKQLLTRIKEQEKNPSMLIFDLKETLQNASEIAKSSFFSLARKINP